MLQDSLYLIVKEITEKIKILYNHEMTSYNWPNWVQAGMLFEISVCPCEDLAYYTEELYTLAKNILKDCQKNKYIVEYYQRDKNGNKVNKWNQDLTNTANSIRKWIRKYENIKH